MSAAALPDIERVRDALRSVVDPEAGINIVELGLAYDIRHADGVVAVDMTMTSPACPMGEMIMDDARAAIAPLLPDGAALDLRLVWEPPWSPACMSDKARAHFGWDGFVVRER